MNIFVVVMLIIENPIQHHMCKRQTIGMVGTCTEIERRYVEERFDRTNKQKTTTRQTKDPMERHGGKGYETGCNNRLGVGRRKMERLTSGTAGPQRTVKLLKTKKKRYICFKKNVYTNHF